MYAQDPFLSAPSLVSRIHLVGCQCQPLLTNGSTLCLADRTVLLLLSAHLCLFWTKRDTNCCSARHGSSGRQGQESPVVRVCVCVCVCVAGPAYRPDSRWLHHQSIPTSQSTCSKGSRALEAILVGGCNPPAKQYLPRTQRSLPHVSADLCSSIVTVRVPAPRGPQLLRFLLRKP